MLYWHLIIKYEQLVELVVGTLAHYLVLQLLVHCLEDLLAIVANVTSDVAQLKQPFQCNDVEGLIICYQYWIAQAYI